ncbi:MAG: hypothetical protein ACKVGW_22460, partial [Verrucomicrobiia bacterium]
MILLNAIAVSGNLHEASVNSAVYEAFELLLSKSRSRLVAFWKYVGETLSLESYLLENAYETITPVVFT